MLAGSAADLSTLLPPLEVEALDNGLQVCVLENRRAPVVTTALWYRAGSRDDRPGHGGTAHFLEHMMFKGSAAYGVGEIDRLTQALGGTNNAQTSHDGTLYHFSFAPDRWRTALAIEADRMAGLRLAAAEVDAERQVIAEEIAMYEGEPWDALERQVMATFFGPHPYGRPVLGSRAELAMIDPTVLADFHRRCYRPANAVLVVAGDVQDDARRVAVEAFAGLPPLAGERVAATPRPPLGELRRIERRRGEVSRLLLALPAPPLGAADHPLLRLLLAVLADGRASRLQRALVDDGQLCSWATADLGDDLEPGCWTAAAEVVPGVEPGRVEAALLDEIDGLRRRPPSADELARAKRIVYADWIFGHEKVYEQALSLGFARAFLGPGHPWSYLERLLSARVEELRPVAERYLRPEADGVLGWSLGEA